jgi:predicted unusual protein kinase regulating ubiquinone biosynthesis (AarF/ABC1/UbiB family)
MARRVPVLSVAERVYRARRIGVTFGRIYLGIKTNQFIARRLSPSDMAERWSAFHSESANAIYETAVDLRGLILKGCQFIGSRADVLPSEYVEILSRLQDRVPAKPFRVVRQTVEEEFDCALEDVFSDFDEQSLASASLAQVHRATLRSGEPVAVKVQYPEIATLVHSDLSNLRVLFRTVGLVERDFDLMPLVDELGKLVPLELNFVNEAHNAERVARFYDDRDDVHVPRIHWGYTTRRVLVSEFIEGVKISDAAALRAAGVDPDDVMRILIEAYCEQIFARGFFHADPHPGNLIVQPGSPGGGPRLVFVDFGLAKELPARFRHGVVELTAALVQGSAERMAVALHALGFETREGGAEALHDIAVVVLEAAVQLRQQAWADRDVAGDAGRALPRMIRENPIVRIPSHVVLLGRVVALLSGLGRTLEARVDMVRTILPYVLKSAATAARPATGDSPSPP